ncbi:MAG: hypothetical protein GEU95_16680 [Rhizobiales bacterium]|nr:hypothetical protein [Hyphomicrobiales bacterium]
MSAPDVDCQSLTVRKGHAMPLNPDDSDYRRELTRETNEEGMSTTAWAGIAVAAMLVGGVAMYAFSSSETNTASSTLPGIEKSAPPVTTGQGGAQSRTPAEKKAE